MNRRNFTKNSGRRGSSRFEKNSLDKDFQKNQKKDFSKKYTNENSYKKNYKNSEFSFRRNKKNDDFSEPKDIRLNRFIANAGICSRRDADTYIVSGNVSVNNQIVNELGYRVKPTDVVRFDGKIISAEKKEYILLNKPKGFITTTQDEKGRKTVMELVANATSAKVNPVGRLDRATTGLLLFTNDGDLAKKLTHPSHQVRKIYHAVLDRKLELADYHKIQDGLTLEDGFVQVDEIHYVENAPKNEIGLRIHSGKNRIVRRIFESLNYEVQKLDRVAFAGLTKKDLPRGHWRHLTEKEIINLKNIK